MDLARVYLRRLAAQLRSGTPASQEACLGTTCPLYFLDRDGSIGTTCHEVYLREMAAQSRPGTGTTCLFKIQLIISYI